MFCKCKCGNIKEDLDKHNKRHTVEHYIVVAGIVISWILIGGLYGLVL